MRLAHDLSQHVEPAAMRHAEHDVADAQRAAALDDLLERRDHQLAPSSPKRLVPVYLMSMNFSNPSASISLLRIARLPCGGEGDRLVGSFDALLDPGLLRGIGDVHELHAERRAIGPAEDGQHLADSRELQSEHVIDEDLPVVVRLGEAVARGMQLLVIARRRQSERIEIGMQMTAHPVGADHHQRPQGIARRLVDLLVGDFDAARLRAGLDLLADASFKRKPIAVEGGDDFAIGDDRPVAAPPLRPARLGDGGVLRVLQLGEETAPVGIERARALLIAGVKVFEIGGVAAIEK